MLIMTNRQKALAALITCVLFWGFSFVSIKIAIAVFPPMTLGALRFVLAVIIPFFIKRKLSPEEKLCKEDIPFLVGAGLTGVTFYFFFENNGVARIPASEASIIIGSIPVITLIAEGIKGKIISGRELSRREPGLTSAGKPATRKTLFKVIGALISLSGVTLVAGVSLTLSGSALGYFFMAGACISWVCYCFLMEPLFKRRSRIYIVFWQSVAGLIGFLPFVIFEPSWQMPELYVWGNVIFLGVCCSAFAYWLYSMALRDLGVGTATLFVNFIPVISAIGGFFILGERLLPLQWCGAVLVLAGVYLAMVPSWKKGGDK